MGFYVAFNTVQVISQRVVGRAEETSTYSSSGFCTVNCRPCNGKQLPALPLETMPGTEPRPQRWEARVLPLCHHGPYESNGSCYYKFNVLEMVLFYPRHKYCSWMFYTTFAISKVPLWVRGCRIGPTYPPACHKRRLIGGSLFAVCCDPCQWKRGSWLLSQYFVAPLRRQCTALASISLSWKVKMAWLNQSAGSAKP